MSNKAEIKDVVGKILEARSNTKLIPDLIQALSEKSTTKSALNGLLKVFTHLIKKGDLKPANTQNESDPAYKYSTWICKVFDEAFEKIVELIDQNDEQSCKILCLTTSIKLLKLAHEDLDEKKTWTTKDINRFKEIIESVVSKDHKNANLIDRFQEYSEKLFLRPSIPYKRRNFVSKLQPPPL